MIISLFQLDCQSEKMWFNNLTDNLIYYLISMIILFWKITESQQWLAGHLWKEQLTWRGTTVCKFGEIKTQYFKFTTLIHNT